MSVQDEMESLYFTAGMSSARAERAAAVLLGQHAHELAERQRAKANQLAVFRSEDMRLKAEGLRMGADLIDPQKEGQ
ncbi:hypothetical protein AB0E62_00300 [Streptomyces sp. NPDC038707]|uniref:hypothetical protein n=1 Tax=Streptomyces sp. NPDC038707 TaxID=3154329 RepID=UPI0033D293E6